MDKWLAQHRYLLLGNLVGILLAMGLYFLVLMPQTEQLTALRTAIADGKEALDKGKWPADKEQLEGNLKLLQDDYSRKSDDFLKAGKRQKAEILMEEYVHLLTERVRREGYRPAEAAKKATEEKGAHGSKPEAAPGSQEVAAFFIKEASKDQYLFEGKFQEFYNTYTSSSGRNLRAMLFPDAPPQPANSAFNTNSNGYIWIGSAKEEIERRFGSSSLSKGSETQPTYQLFLKLWAVDEAFKLAIHSGLLVARDEQGNSCVKVLPVRGYAINSGDDAKPYLLEVPIRVKFRGDMRQFCDFLGRIRQKETFMPVASLEANCDPLNRSLWTFDVELVAFFPLEGGDLKSKPPAGGSKPPPGA